MFLCYSKMFRENIMGTVWVGKIIINTFNMSEVNKWISNKDLNRIKYDNEYK